MLRWDEAMLASYLRRRSPGLIVLEYGTNEAAAATFKFESYRTMFSNLLQRLRRAVPGASILVIGPPDGYLRYHGKWQLLAEVDAVTAAQQSACRENACAFWDTRERMGGVGSMRDWVFAGLAQADYIHFTFEGYRRLAAVLFGDIMKQYETFQKIRMELSEPVSHGQPNQNR
jgi:lysophospholipase L1-like esterase